MALLEQIDRQTEVKRGLFPLDLFAPFVEAPYKFVGIPDSSLAANFFNASLSLPTSGRLIWGTHAPWGGVYEPQVFARDWDCDPCRYIINRGLPINFENALIFPAYDRLRSVNGEPLKVAAKIIAESDYEGKGLVIAQREAELIAHFSTDPILGPRMLSVHHFAILEDATHNFEKKAVMIQEYCSWPTLSSVETLSALTVSEKLFVTKQICEIADRFRLHGVLYRDYKDDNFFVDSNGTIRYCDPGVSSWVYRLKEESHGVGSHMWASPEMWQYTPKNREPGFASDIYSMSALFYYIFSEGKFPYDVRHGAYERPIFQSAHHGISTQAEPWSGHALVGLSQEQQARSMTVFEKGLAVDPSDRYQSGRELYRALEDVLNLNS